MLMMTGEKQKSAVPSFDKPNLKQGLAEKIGQKNTATNAQKAANPATSSNTDNVVAFEKSGTAKQLNQRVNVSEQYSRISKGNQCAFSELWISPSQVRKTYDQKNIKRLVKDFLNPKIGQINPMTVSEIQNPDNPYQHLNIVSGHNRYKAWEVIYTDPKYAHLISDAAWVDKHRPRVILQDELEEAERLIHQVHENVVRSDLLAWDICVGCVQFINLEYVKTGKKLTATNVIRDEFGIEENYKKYATIANIILNRNLLQEGDEFVSKFSNYKITSPRPLLTFFNVYDHAVEKGIVANLTEWLEYLDTDEFQETLELDSDVRLSHYLALMFDDYLPTSDEAVSNSELLERRAKNKQAENAAKAAENPVVAQAPQEPAQPVVETFVQAAAQPVAQPTAVQTQVPVNTPAAPSAPIQTAAVAATPAQPVSVAVAQPTAQPVVEPTASATINVRSVDIEANTTANEESKGFVHANNADELQALFNNEVKSHIAEHFIDVLSKSDTIEVGRFFEKLYNRLGDDLVEEVAKAFYEE